MTKGPKSKPNWLRDTRKFMEALTQLLLAVLAIAHLVVTYHHFS